MKQKINLRLGLIALVALILTTVGVTKVYYDLFRQQVGRDLRLTAHLLGRSGEFTRGNAPALQDPEVRITWVDADGTVLYDDEADAGALPNHADRPEIRQAMDTGEGEIVRTSDTFNMNTFYYALRLDDGTVLRPVHQLRIFGGGAGAADHRRGDLRRVPAAGPPAHRPADRPH